MKGKHNEKPMQTAGLNVGAECDTDIVASLQFADQAQRLRFAELLQGVSKRQIRTCWLILARQLHFAVVKKTVDFANNVAVSGAAKTSTRAAREKTYDRGTEGFLRQLREAGVDTNFSRRTILRAEKILEALGIVQYERQKHRVALGHINLRAAALFLEAYHPEYEDLMEKTDGLYKWLKPFCDDILGGGWRRKNSDEGDIYDAAYYEEDLALFQARFPSRKFNIASLATDVCYKLVKWSGGLSRFKPQIQRVYKTVCVWWDVDISDPPDECAYI